ncbi:Protein kinase protein rad53 [Coniosporium apollinis]|uniref:non-specific serine/threonine protein kinase n=1 Tax=Coniosporium apollinis TaxID=61459 RepID=A0ABQ9P5K8_9PEZI|nr:Protein kinase protein rad53 [Coniosporium apollinis]
MENEATQPSTQQILDPRRLGRNNSGLSESDISDVICILHPCSLAAIRIVRETARLSPQHVLQNNELVSFDYADEDPDEKETFIVDAGKAQKAQDLALRFSSQTLKPFLGFCFGRNSSQCDVVIGLGSAKRVSNMHFRIFMNKSGIIMLEDTSTNGTMVEEVVLKGKAAKGPTTRMLQSNVMIQILSPDPDEHIKFVVTIPPRDGHSEEYYRNFAAYMERLSIAERAQYPALQHQPRPAFDAAQLEIAAQRGQQGQKATTALAGPTTRLRSAAAAASSKPSVYASTRYGMHWNGDGIYNVTGVLGKGAFATVFQLATAMDGQILAAKELEKRRFIKNGQLDQKLDNEMRIMKTLVHRNIVQYVDYVDAKDHIYIIMEYVPCGDLQDYLKENDVLHEAAAKRMAYQILNALAYLHRKNITHRDIKPDNILIASLDPFEVKLSDFGLSKVVQHDETFLKTFCGTLLYCAPEVFPHYGTHAATKGSKRRKPGTAPPSQFHSYSQSVDIWSFAAVLWFALCSKPPFEGVVDHQGRGMFEKIMTTTPDVNPLRAHGVSPQAIDLLIRMLNTDPSSRPTEQQCLRHPWFDDLRTAEEASGLDVNYELNAIPEESDEVLQQDPDLCRENTADDALMGLLPETSKAGVKDPSPDAFSQLSINDRVSDRESFDNEADLSSDEFRFPDPRVSKRVKPDPLYPRDQHRGYAATDSSPEESYQSIPVMRQPDESFTVPQHTARPPRLFGEIGQSALASSGILGERTNRALEVHDASTSTESSTRVVSTIPGEDHDYDQDHGHAQGLQAAQSLLGAESMVRELNMASPGSGNSPAASLDQPPTPKTPESLPNSSIAHEDAETQGVDRPEEVTPKQPSFSRRIHLPIPTEFFFEQYDQNAHNSEYTSNGSDQDYAAREAAGSRAMPSLPATMTGSLDETDAEQVDVAPAVFTPPENNSQFKLPPPVFGRLEHTPDSFAPIVLKIDRRVTSWGRNPSNTIVYRDGSDTRVPKAALTIYFHAPGIEKMDREGKDWTKMDGLYTGIFTNARNGIWVNGVGLKPSRDKEFFSGHLHTGDVITIFQGGRSEAPLKFKCEFFHGEAAQARSAGSRFIVERTTFPGSQ